MNLNANLYLIGFMGAGKSTIARTLEQACGMHVVEMDEEIVKRHGCSIPEIFAKYGEAHFRQAETDLLQELNKETNQVISCGGGVVLRPENVALMKEGGILILLQAEPETILERVKEDNNRPLLAGKKDVASIRQLMETRLPHYEKAADCTIQVDGKTPEAICEEIWKGMQR